MQGNSADREVELEDDDEEPAVQGNAHNTGKETDDGITTKTTRGKRRKNGLFIRFVSFSICFNVFGFAFLARASLPFSPHTQLGLYTPSVADRGLFHVLVFFASSAAAVASLTTCGGRDSLVGRERLRLESTASEDTSTQREERRNEAEKE